MPLQGPNPKPGDLIEFQRFAYQHWGIYVGNGEIVHLTDQDGWSSLSSAFGETAVVKKDRLERVAAGCVYKVNNKYDQKRRPYPPTKIVRAALEQVGKRLQYSVTSANCEHFVTELRYGDGFSDQGRAWGASSQRSCGEKMAQVDDAKTYAVGGGIALAAVAAVMFSGMRNNRQKN
ncbi:phospholipase A and acyltransferase 2-like isoform X4 [Pseudophryne corroboree]|uniref:phospholipase A and acyltransferase 2-like isoform X4 n=1 Tax=Pseudophryne corroboree TaxID=495146 RepID=UPI00308219FE